MLAEGEGDCDRLVDGVCIVETVRDPDKLGAGWIVIDPTEILVVGVVRAADGGDNEADGTLADTLAIDVEGCEMLGDISDVEGTDSAGEEAASDGKLTDVDGIEADAVGIFADTCESDVVGAPVERVGLEKLTEVEAVESDGDAADGGPIKGELTDVDGKPIDIVGTLGDDGLRDVVGIVSEACVVEDSNPLVVMLGAGKDVLGVPKEVEGMIGDTNGTLRLVLGACTVGSEADPAEDVDNVGVLICDVGTCELRLEGVDGDTTGIFADALGVWTVGVCKVGVGTGGVCRLGV